jgi:hypothetical protein
MTNITDAMSFSQVVVFDYHVSLALMCINREDKWLLT